MLLDWFLVEISIVIVYRCVVVKSWDLGFVLDLFLCGFWRPWRELFVR